MIEDSSLNGNQGIIQKEEFMLTCGQKKKRRRKRKLQTTACMYDYHLRKFSRSYDITETISGRRRSEKPKSTISGMFSLPQAVGH